MKLYKWDGGQRIPYDAWDYVGFGIGFLLIAWSVWKVWS